jgi:hypothetical protein
MVMGNYRDLFVVITSSAATLIGLLFVALSVSESRSNSRLNLVQQFRAAASFLAFINALIVSLFGLVPGTNLGYPATALGVGGVLFTAAGVRRILTLPVRQNLNARQPSLVGLLLVVFGFQLWLGIELLVNANRPNTVGDIGYVLITSLIIGIARSWELVGYWDTGMWASLAVLLGLSSSTGEATPPDDGENASAREDPGSPPGK